MVRALALALLTAWPAAAQVPIAVSAEPPLPVPNLMANAEFEAGDARAPEGWGARDVVELMPVLHELLSEGWQADPGFTADERLWTARYGTGVHGFLVVGNPTREKITAEVRPTPSPLGRSSAPMTARSAQCEPTGRAARSSRWSWGRTSTRSCAGRSGSARASA